MITVRAFVAIIALASALSGCARPAASVLLPSDNVAPGAKRVTLYVATTRVREQGAPHVYTDARSATLNYAEFVIAIPPNHTPGDIEWPSGVPDPQNNFVTVSQTVLSSEEFARKVSAQANRKAGVFVHGYNYNFQESLFRLAQMVADADVAGVPILYAWPSDATLAGYVADKDAATYSRDGLANLLTTLASDRRPGEVTLLGHSMGAWLTAEALRQLRMTGRSAALNRLTVVLAAPDIDVDVFRSQLRVIGPMKPPMTVLVSRTDRALAFSGRIAGERPRLGALDVDDPRVQEGARAAGVRLIDISSVKSSDEFNHDGFVTFATLYSRLGPTERRSNTAGQAGAFVFNSVGNVLSAPFSLVGSALAGQ